MARLITDSNLPYLEKVRESLEIEGIFSKIIEEKNAFMSSEGYGIKFSIIVKEEEVERAERILQTVERDNENVSVTCEKCGSDAIDEEIVERQRSVWWLYTGFILIIFFLILTLVCLKLYDVLLIPGGLGIIIVILCFSQYYNKEKCTVYKCRKCNHKFSYDIELPE